MQIAVGPLDLPKPKEKAGEPVGTAGNWDPNNPNNDLPLGVVCPCCKSKLHAGSRSYRCVNLDCGRRFPVISGQPALVDFSESILDESDFLASGGQSAIRRGRNRPSIPRYFLPTNRVAAGKAKAFKSLALSKSSRPRLLIIGGGSKGAGTEALYDDSAFEVLSFDVYASPLTQFIADAHKIPLADASIDAVWIQAVLEHVLDPWSVCAEIHRVLREGGIVYAETPFLQQVHEGAYDFTRFTPSGHRWLFRRFEEIEAGVVLGTASQLLWSIEHLVRGLFRSMRAGVIVKILLFWVRGLDRLIPEPFASDAASAVYFLGTKSSKTLKPKDMPSYYKGAYPRKR